VKSPQKRSDNVGSFTGVRFIGTTMNNTWRENDTYGNDG
jgi:hypothetical protein